MTHLKLDNFKIWKSTGPMRLAPVTLLLARAMLVHPDFVQGIGEHWRRRRIEWNRIEHGAGHEPAGVTRG